jgi:hypothetical protein
LGQCGGDGMLVAGTRLASLPVQRPKPAKGAPVLILGIRRVVANGKLLARSWWAIVLPGI